MKRFAIIAAAASAGAFAASAGEMAAFTDIDADGDGVVTESEFVTYKTADGEHTEAEATEKFAKIDADASGDVTEAELTTAMEKWEEEKESWDEKTDSDADVELDSETTY